MVMFALERHITCITFLLPYNVFIRNMFVCGIEGILSCIRYPSPFNVLVFVLEGNLPHARFIFPYNVIAFNIFMF
jgi:hypothetical protein